MCQNKTRYTSEDFALKDIERIQSKSARDKVPQRTYKCNICGFWHLTSQVSKEDLFREIGALKAENKELQAENKELKRMLDAREKNVEILRNKLFGNTNK
jgi:hypothetical protein